jgi:LCP family protein required for cell wall assembly
MLMATPNIKRSNNMSGEGKLLGNEASGRPPRGLGQLRRRRKPWYKRPGVLSTVIFVSSMLLTAAVCWWFIPVTDPISGDTKTYGMIMTDLVRNSVQPRKSLAVSFPDQDEVRVLLVGLDHVPSGRKGDPAIIRRSDSVMLASVSFETKQVRIMSIPRDGWVQHWQNGQNFGWSKVANAYSFGQEYNLAHDRESHPGGINRITETVSHLVDLPVDYYVVIDFNGLEKLVDALGGLEVDVEQDMNHDDYAGNLHIHLKQGLQTLNGEQLVQYARYRDKKLGDLGRMPRQQKVVRLLLEEMMKKKHLPKLPELAGMFYESVQTNLTLDQLLALVQNVDQFDTAGIKTKTIYNYWNLDNDPPVKLPGLPEEELGNAQVIPNSARSDAREWLRDLAPPPPPEPEPAADADGAADPAPTTE